MLPEHYEDKETAFQYFSLHTIFSHKHIYWVVVRMDTEMKSVHLSAAAGLPPKITKSIYVP